MPPAKLTAVLGNCKRVGRWKIRPTTKALVLFGNCSIDYTDAYADDDLEEIKLDVLCLFGRAVFTLPAGANVQPSAVSLLSSSKFEVEEIEQTCELPIIKMESTTVFGVCRVVTADEVEGLALHEPPAGEEPVMAEPPPVGVLTPEEIASIDEVPPIPVPPPPPPLDLPIEPLRATGALDTLEPPDIAPSPPTGATVEPAEHAPDEASPSDRPWLDELDKSKAVVIDDDTDTVHIAA